MADNHIMISDLPYCEPIKEWLGKRYGGDEAAEIWKKTEEQYNEYLIDLPDYGGRKNVHAMAIYGGLIIFSMYPLLPDQPPVSEIQDFVANLFMGPFVKLGKIIDLNRSFDMWLINKVFQKTGDGDRRDIAKYPEDNIDYRLNIHNKKAEEFYAERGAKVTEYALEAQNDFYNSEVMTSKYCIKNQFGLCPQKNCSKK